MAQTLVEMAANGRLVIPAAVRSELGLRGRERLAVDCANGSIVLTPVVAVPVDRSFPITPELAAAAERAAGEPGHRLNQDQLRALLADSVTP